MADINTPILSLKTLEVDETGANGSHIHLKGVVPGFINSILRIMGIAGSTDLRMNASYLELRTGSAKGQSSWFVPTGSLSSVQGGYRKEFILLPMAAVLFVLSIIGDIVIAGQNDDGFSLLFTWLGLIFVIVLSLIYFFTKTMYFEIESGGGLSARIQFKGAINLDNVEQALVVMQALIAKAQFDGDVVVMGKISNVVIPETPVQQTQQQEILPQTEMTTPSLEDVEVSTEQTEIQSEETSTESTEENKDPTIHVDENGDVYKWDGSAWIKES
jgi:hypothetical protein